MSQGGPVTTGFRGTLTEDPRASYKVRVLLVGTHLAPVDSERGPAGLEILSGISHEGPVWATSKEHGLTVARGSLRARSD